MKMFGWTNQLVKQKNLVGPTKLFVICTTIKLFCKGNYVQEQKIWNEDSTKNVILIEDTRANKDFFPFFHESTINGNSLK